MNNVIGGRPPSWLRIVAGVALLWNLFGCYAYLQTVGALPGGGAMAEQAMPTWVTAAFATSVFAGALGSLGLLLLKSWSKLLLLLSLLCVLAQDVWAFALRATPSSDGPVLPIVVTVVAIVLAWLAYDAGKKGWLS